MVIREFDSASDLEGLRQCVISLQNFERGFDSRMPPGEDIADNYINDIFERCSKHEGKVLVADSNGSVAGYVLVLCKVVSDEIIEGDLEFGRIGDLVVLEAYRGMGFGKKLLTAAEHYAKEKKVKWLRIGVLSANSVAEKIYIADGFVPLTLELEKPLS